MKERECVCEPEHINPGKDDQILWHFQTTNKQTIMSTMSDNNVCCPKREDAFLLCSHILNAATHTGREGVMNAILENMLKGGAYRNKEGRESE